MKVKLPLCLNKHHAVRAYGQVDVQLHAFSTWSLDGSDSFTFRPLYPRG